MTTRHDNSHPQAAHAATERIAAASLDVTASGNIDLSRSLNEIVQLIVHQRWNDRAQWLPDFCVWLLSSPVCCWRLWNDKAYSDHLEKIVVAFDLKSDACEFFHVANPLRALRDSMRFTDQVERKLVDAAVFVAVAGVQLAKTDMPCDVESVAGLFGAAVDCIARARFGSLKGERVHAFKKTIVAKIDELCVGDYDRSAARVARALAVIAGGGCPSEDTVVQATD